MDQYNCGHFGRPAFSLHNSQLLILLYYYYDFHEMHVEHESKPPQNHVHSVRLSVLRVLYYYYYYHATSSLELPLFND